MPIGSRYDQDTEANFKARQTTTPDERCCSREPTIGEHLDAQIIKAELALSVLRDLKASLAGSYLASGVSRLGGTALT